MGVGNYQLAHCREDAAYAKSLNWDRPKGIGYAPQGMDYRLRVGVWGDSYPDIPELSHGRELPQRLPCGLILCR